MATNNELDIIARTRSEVLSSREPTKTMAFKFPVINPLLHNELRLKIMVALDSLESASFMYLCEITDATRGNLSVQITTLSRPTNKVCAASSPSRCPRTTNRK